MPCYSYQQLIDTGKFSPTDLKKILTYRGKHNRLGFAYQLIFMRLLNYFPQQKPFEINTDILSFTALQLDIASNNIREYQKHRQHIARHQQHIRAYLGVAIFNTKASKLEPGAKLV